MKKQGQNATEYVIILGVMIIISVIVVTLLKWGI